MTEYALIDTNDALLRVERHATRPADPIGKGWRWVDVEREEGEAFDGLVDGVWTIRTPAPPPPVVVVTPRQARLVLLQAGHLDAVEAMLAQPGNEAAQITWEYALEIRRDDALVTAIGSALGLTDAQIDALFEAAKVL